MQTFCSLPGCDGERHAKGRCGKHYQRWRRRQPPGTLADVRRWTKEEDAALCQLRLLGRHTRAEIAQRLGRSLGGVRDRARILRLPPMHSGRKPRCR